MLGRDLIKAIIDNGLVEDDIVIVGMVEDNDIVDVTKSISITELNVVEMEEGDVAAIVINGSLAE